MRRRKWENINSAQVVEKDPFMVQFFEPNLIGDAHRLNDLKFEVLYEDFVRKVQEPRLIAVGRNRVNYIFSIENIFEIFSRRLKTFGNIC